MNGEVPQEREAAVCVLQVGQEHPRGHPRRGAEREVRIAGE